MLASFLWLIHALNTVYTKTFVIDVTFKNIPVDKKPVIPLPEKISLDIKASGLKLLFIHAKNSSKKFEIDFNILKSINRRKNYILSASKINYSEFFNTEFQVKRISPDTLFFSDNSGFQRIVPVKVPLNLSCKGGFGYGKTVITPDKITIYGDSVSINQIDTLRTQTLSLNEISSNVSKTIVIDIPSENVFVLNPEVVVNIDIEPLIEHYVTTKIRDIQNTKINIYPSEARIKFTCLQNDFVNSDTALFLPKIDSKQVNHKTNKCIVFLKDVPRNATVISVEPKEVEILLTKEK